MDYPEWDIPDSKTINSISFEMYTSEEIKRLSVKPLTNSETFDSLLHPQPNGLHDLALGSLYNYICYTCGQPPATCTGHLGHIPLPLLLYNPMLYRMMVKILNLSCYKCHMLVLNKEVLQLIQSKISLIKGGHLIACSEISDKTNDPNKIQELLNSQPKLEVANDEKQRQIRHVQHEWKECLALLKETSRNACPHCSATRLTLRHFQNCQIFVTKLTAQTKTKIKKEEDDKMTVQANLFDPAFKKSYLTPVEVRERMRKVWEQNSYILKMAYDFLDIDVEYPTDLFFLEVIPVIPTCFRPCVVLRSKKFESVQTSSYKRILQESEKIQEILRELKKTDKDQTENDKNLIEINAINDVKTKGLRKRLNESWLTLQKNVNWLYDDSGDSSSYSIRGVRQILEKKDGLFRKHMMGKRVNYVARSVITPDPNIEVAEVGVPEIFAKTLTYPQPVTPWNVDKLRKMVINGPDEYPGATFVVDQHGVKQRLLADKPTQRESIANQLLTPSTANKPLVTCKKVYRHLINGDYLLLNRQPSLHKPSIQAHRARVLPNIKTFRLHYANCKAYNADFDGDEMTAHVPQNELGRAEAKEISSAHHQYVVPKDGSPLAGLIQDHVVAGVRLTIRGRFFRREEFNQLLFGALVNKPDAIKLLPPAIIRPEKLWSGKQLISTLLINIIPKNKPLITMESTSKIPERLWNRFGHFISSYSRALSNEMGESHVIIRDSELLCGVLDKSQYGSTAYGLVHCCYELYGGEVAANLLTCFGRLFTCFLQRDGFSLGIKDILMTEQADQKRKNIIDYIKTYDIDKSREELQVVVGENTKSISEIVFGNDPMLVAELDKKVKKITNDVQNSILRAIMPSGLLVKFPDNNLQLMINAGAKGSSVNAMQISCLLGQIELEGRRPPMMPSGRFLPSFLQYDISPQAGGFITGRFLTGISPQEFFVHCMAGREGLIDTTVKTSHSGYLQRCLVKHLEGLIVNYDLTVRDSDGSIIQFYYGEDSLDVTKTQFIGENHFPLLIKNRASILNHHVPLKEADSNLDCRQIQNKIFEIGQQRSSPKRYNAEKSAFLRFCEKKQNEVEVPENIPCMMGRSLKSTYLCNLWHKMSEKRRQKYQKKIVSCPDPVLSKIQPYSQHGTISEELYKMARNFCSNPDNSHRICPPGQVETKETITEENFEKLINYKFLQCMVDPGEAVGLISSQSVGEPSTQMTLNTFHFAGLGEMNVTLGIPRLREILFGTHFIKTPTMDIPVLDTDFAKIEAKKLQKKLNPVTLSQVLERVDVTDRIEMSSELNDRLYIVHFQFLHPSKYQDQLATDPDEILHHIETKYITDLLKSINSTIKLTQTSLRILPKDLAWTVNSTLENFAEPSADKENGGGSADEGGEENELPVDAERRDESKDSESSEDETDEVAGKLRKQTIDEHDYDDDDDNNSDDDDDDDDNNSETERKESNTMEFKEDNDDEDNKEIILEEPFYFDNGDKKTRREAAKGKYLDSFSKAVLSYKYDEEDNLWCEVVFKFDLRLTKVDLLTIIKDNAETSVIHKVPGIKRSILTNVKTRTGIELHLQTEGINISYIQQFGNILDIDRFYCNSPMTMAQTYGIEAGLKVIIKEIQSVFGVYGIKVNYRHLSLIADYMAFEGQLIFFNQNGMQACPSPLQQITFESAYRGITNAASKHLKDYLHSPTSQLVTGKLPTLGTGHFDILLPLIPVK